MSHAIEIVDGVASMAYAGEVPWHGLGQRVPDEVTIDEMITQAGLDWKVSKQAMRTSGNVTVPGHKALVRMSDNTVLDVVGDKQWEPVQNREAFEFFSPFLDNKSMTLHTAGSLLGGTKVWCLARVQSDFELFNGDKVEGFLLFTNFHQYGKSTDIRFTPVRVVCNNTISMALGMGAKHQVKISHKRKFDAAEAQAMLGVVHDQMMTYKELVQFLGNRRCSHDDLKRYLAAAFPQTGVKAGEKFDPLKSDVVPAAEQMSRNARIAEQIIDTQPGAEFAQGTFWQAYNAVTFMTNHQVGHNDQSRLDSAWYGPNQALNVKAMKLATAMAEKAPKLAVAA